MAIVRRIDINYSKKDLALNGIAFYNHQNEPVLLIGDQDKLPWRSTTSVMLKSGDRLIGAKSRRGWTA